MGKIFLTGSKGFVGSALLPKLIEQGYEVETDMRYLHTKKYDCVIHLAARTDIGCGFDAELIESNILLTKEIFKTNSRIIFGSSCSAAHLTNPYSYTKRYGEYLCGIHGNAIALRFHNIYGKNASRGIVKFLCDQKDGSKITIRGCELVRDYVAVENVADYILALVGNTVHLGNTTYPDSGLVGLQKLLINASMTGVMDVGTGKGWRTIDVVELYCYLSGKTFEIETIPPDDSEPLSMIADRPLVGAMSLEEGLLKLINNE